MVERIRELLSTYPIESIAWFVVIQVRLLVVAVAADRAATPSLPRAYLTR